jgi:hypothetical protein
VWIGLIWLRIEIGSGLLSTEPSGSLKERGDLLAS